jgi:hypothetical protein
MTRVLNSPDLTVSQEQLLTAKLELKVLDRAEIMIDHRLWSPPRLIAAIDTLNAMRSTNLSAGIKLKDLPSAVQDYVLSMSAGLATMSDGSPVFGKDSTLEVSLTTSLVLDGQGPASRYTFRSAPKEPGKENDQVSKLVESGSSTPDGAKQELRIRFSRSVNDETYWQAVLSVSELLKARREYWTKLYDEALGAFMRTQFGDVQIATKPGDSAGRLPKAMRDQMSISAAREGKLDNFDEQKVKDVRQSVNFTFKVGNIRISFDPRQFFDTN